MSKFCFGLVVLCAIFDIGSAIMCYECNSATNSYCNEAVLPDSLKRNCSEHDRGITHTLCRKIVQHVDFGINGQLPASRVIRSCGWDETKYKRNCSEHDRGITLTLCRKIVQHVDFGINGQLPASRVIRSCGWDETKYKGACYHRSGYGGRQEVCSCTKDFCNSSDDTRATFTVIVSTTLALLAKIL